MTSIASGGGDLGNLSIFSSSTEFSQRLQDQWQKNFDKMQAALYSNHFCPFSPAENVNYENKGNNNLDDDVNLSKLFNQADSLRSPPPASRSTLGCYGNQTLNTPSCRKSPALDFVQTHNDSIDANHSGYLNASGESIRPTPVKLVGASRRKARFCQPIRPSKYDSHHDKKSSDVAIKNDESTSDQFRFADLSFNNVIDSSTILNYRQYSQDNQNAAQKVEYFPGTLSTSTSTTTEDFHGLPPGRHNNGVVVLNVLPDECCPSSSSSQFYDNDDDDDHHQPSQPQPNDVEQLSTCPTSVGYVVGASSLLSAIGSLQDHSYGESNERSMTTTTVSGLNQKKINDDNHRCRPESSSSPDGPVDMSMNCHNSTRNSMFIPHNCGGRLTRLVPIDRHESRRQIFDPAVVVESPSVRNGLTNRKLNNHQQDIIIEVPTTTPLEKAMLTSSLTSIDKSKKRKSSPNVNMPIVIDQNHIDSNNNHKNMKTSIDGFVVQSSAAASSSSSLGHSIIQTNNRYETRTTSSSSITTTTTAEDFRNKTSKEMTAVLDKQIQMLWSNSEFEEPLALEELERFSKMFKQKRIQLGFTQGDVGLAMGKLYGTDFSQTTISRFEALNLSFKNMCKLKPLLEKWLDDTETAVKKGTFESQILKAQNCVDISNAKRRKKRTSIEGNSKRMLENIFKMNSRPSIELLESLSNELNMDKEVIRVWFCNRRQKQKRNGTLDGGVISLETTTNCLETNHQDDSSPSSLSSSEEGGGHGHSIGAILNSDELDQMNQSGASNNVQAFNDTKNLWSFPRRISLDMAASTSSTSLATEINMTNIDNDNNHQLNLSSIKSQK